MKDPFVLLLSHRQEPFCTERVASALRRRGACPLRIDTDDFPGALSMSATFDGIGGNSLLLDGEAIDVGAIWLWRLWPARLDVRLDVRLAESAQRESAVTLRGLLDLLIDVPWIDAFDVTRAAENKTRQLRLAQVAGLPIPPTLITSDPEEARRFFFAHDGNVIAKLQTALSHGMQVQSGLPTRLVQRQDLAALDGLRQCPMMFQRYIEKAHELRIAWVDGAAFVGALDGKQCGVDWRYECNARFEHHALPGAVHAALQRLMSSLHLRQGAIDMIVTPAGEYVFLEVNPTGEWGMLEAELDLPISTALADALLRKSIHQNGR